MALKPFQKGQSLPAPLKPAKFRPFVPAQRQPVQPKKDYGALIAQEKAKIDPKIIQEGQRSNEYLKKPWYKQIFTREFAREIPKATADVMVGTPAKFVTSAAEVPYNLATGKASNITYKIPGLSPFKSYQREAVERTERIMDYKQPIWHALKPFAEVPLAGLETLGIAKGIGKAGKALKGAGTVTSKLSKAGAEVVDAFIPTTRGLKTLPEKNLKNAKLRRFAKSVDGSAETSLELSARLEDVPEAKYIPKKNQAGMQRAVNRIATNVDEAERFAAGGLNDESIFTSNELIKHYDSLAQKAKQSGNQAEFDFAMNKAVDIAKQTMQKGTEAGRTVQAFSTIDKLSPEATLNFITKTAKEAGGYIKLSNDDIFNFTRKAGDIKNILDPKERALATFDLMDEFYSKLPTSTQDKVFEVLNLPRAIMSTADLSAPLRQGIFTAAKNPKTFGKNFGRMFKYAFSEKAFKNAKADIITSPNYELYLKHKLPLTDIAAGLSGREEAFMSSLAERIPLFGRLARGSNRAYTGFLNKMRTDLFDDFVKTAELNGITDPKFFDDAARFVGSATGRGDIAKLFGGNEAGKVWSSFFFSPRLMSSRLSLINPICYMKLHPVVRKEALKSLAAFVGTGMGILGLAKLNGAEVGTDPRSADFGKIKIGNTRYDTWGGFQQYARLIGQLVTGEKISTITGKESTLGQGYGAPTRESIIMDFFKSKEAPILSFLTRASQGEQYGEKFNLPVEVINRFIPMVLSDAYDLYKENGAAGVGMALPGAFGVGSQTYGQQIPMLEETQSGAPNIQWKQQPGLGDDIWNSLTGNELSQIPKDQWGALYEEKQRETLHQIEIDKAKREVLETGQPKQVGDTYIFLKDGVIKTRRATGQSRTPLKDRLLYEQLRKKQTQPFYKTQ